MPSNDSSGDINADLLIFAVKTMVQYEKELSKLIAKIESRKNEISTGIEKLNKGIDGISGKIDLLETEIAKLKTFFQRNYAN